MSTPSVPMLLGISMGCSALGGALGMASGIFIVPLLTIAFGVDIHVAIGASLISVIACSCGSAGPLLKEGLTNVRLAIVLEIATTLGAASGVLLSGIVSVSALYAIFTIVLVLSAWQMRRPRLVVPGDVDANRWSRRLDGSYGDKTLGRDVAYRVERLAAGLSLMYGAGLLSALLGIGSGVLKIPAMDTALRLPLKVSSATSSFMVGVTAAASAGAYVLRGAIVADVAGPVVLGSAVGALVGARLLVILPNSVLRIVFVVILLGLALATGCSALGIRIGMSA